MYRSKNKKNITLLCLLISLVVISGIAGVSAYLLNTDEAVNTFTVGNVNIELTEPQWDATYPNGYVENAIAKQVILKDPTITNTGENDAFVYMMVEVPKAYKTKVLIDNNLTEKDHYQLFDYNTNEGWELIDSHTDDVIDGYNYYLYGYKQPISKGDSVTIFETIKFANITSDFKNYITGENITKLSVKVKGYAIQSNFYKENTVDFKNAWDIYVNQNGFEWPYNPYEGSIQDIEKNYEVYYYDKLSSAVTDVNTNQLGDTSTDKEHGKLVVYLDKDNVHNIYFKDNITETTRVTVNTNLNINLAGKVLSFENAGYCIDTGAGYSGTITVDGQVPGSEIKSTGSSNNSVCFQIRDGFKLNLNSVKLSSFSMNGVAYGAISLGDLILKDCNIEVESQNSTCVGIGTMGGTLSANSCNFKASSDYGTANAMIISGEAAIDNSVISVTSSGSLTGGIMVGQQNNYGAVEVSNTNIEIQSNNYYSSAYGISITSKSNGSDLKSVNNTIKCTSLGLSQGITCNDIDSTAIIEGCEILADSEYDISGYSFNCYGLYIAQGTNAIVRSCDITGVHSGIYSSGNLQLNGGTYRGYAYGGFYQSGESEIINIKNAKMLSWDYQGGSFSTDNMTGFIEDTAMYISGNKNNIYLHNVQATGRQRDVVFSSDGLYDGNSLYMSNTTLSKPEIYVESDLNKLYIGENCNLDQSHVTGYDIPITISKDNYDFSIE